MGGVHHPKPVALVQHLDSNIKSDRKQAEQSLKVVCEAHSPGATKHTCACPHLGNWSDRHEAKNMERKVNVNPSGIPWQTKSTMNKERRDFRVWLKK